MPNWCENTLIIYDKDKGQQVIDFMRSDDEKFDFNNIIPMPEDVKETENISLTAKVRKESHGRNWYDWSVKNWGAKWNACRVDIGKTEDGFPRIHFETAWTPPFKVIEAIIDKFELNDFQYEYEELGVGVSGGLYAEGGEATFIEADFTKVDTKSLDNVNAFIQDYDDKYDHTMFLLDFDNNPLNVIAGSMFEYFVYVFRQEPVELKPELAKYIPMKITHMTIGSEED